MTKKKRIAQSEITIANIYDGKTAYEEAVDQGFKGTEQEWLDSLKGTDGTTTYSWVRYADDDKGSGMSSSPDDKKYIGMAFNKEKPNSEASSNPEDYVWSLMPQNIEIDNRNYILNSAKRVAFEEQEDIDTSVQDFKGRNLLLNTSRIENSTRFNSTSVYQHLRRYEEGNDLAFSFDLKILKDGNLNNFNIYPYQGNGLSISSTRTYQPKKLNVWDRVNHFTKIKDYGIRNENWSKGSIAIYDTKGENNYQLNKKYLKLGSVATPYQPAPEDLTYAKEYQLAKPLKQDRTYTLSTETTDTDWLGVWLGKDYFAGYVENGQLEFKDNRNNNYLLNSNELKNTGGLGSGITRRINSDGHLEITAEKVNGNYASGLGIELDKNHNLKDGDDITVSVEVKSLDGSGYITLYLGPGMSYQRLNGDISSEFSTIKYTRKWNSDSSWSPHMGFRGAEGSFVFRNIKLEKGPQATPYISAEDNRDSIIIKSLSDKTVLNTAMLNRGDRAMDWTPAPEDIDKELKEREQEVKREEIDRKQEISRERMLKRIDSTSEKYSLNLEMKVGYNSYTRRQPNSLYFHGYQLNTKTNRYEEADVNGELLSPYNEQKWTIPKQSLNLIGVPAGTSGYVIWDNTKRELDFIYLKPTVDKDNNQITRDWIKTKPNPRFDFNESVFVIGEVVV